MKRLRILPFFILMISMGLVFHSCSSDDDEISDADGGGYIEANIDGKKVRLTSNQNFADLSSGNLKIRGQEFGKSYVIELYLLDYQQKGPGTYPLQERADSDGSFYNKVRVIIHEGPKARVWEESQTMESEGSIIISESLEGNKVVYTGSFNAHFAEEGEDGGELIVSDGKFKMSRVQSF